MTKKKDFRNKVTVVIPNYNGMAYIRDCLDSLRAQTALPRIIVVDNHSQDGSLEVVEKEYPEVLVLKIRANTGFCHAVNCGLHITQTKYVILLNNDTRAEKTFVEELVAAISQSGKIFSAQAKMLSMKDPSVIDDAGDQYCALGWAFARGKAEKKEKYDHAVEIFSSCAGAAIYRMKVFDKIGWFDERHYCYLEDVDVGYRAQIYGYINVFAPKAVVYHAGSATSGSVHNAFKETMTAGNNYYLLYKNMPAAQYVFNYPLIRLGRAVKRSYFKRKGLGESYDRGIARGEYMRAVASEEDWMVREEYPYRKQSVADEACVEGTDDALKEIYPIWLGGKVPFELKHLPNYFRIQGKLFANTVERLKTRVQ